MLGAKGSAQWTMGKEKAGELLPSLPSYNNNNIIILFILLLLLLLYLECQCEFLPLALGPSSLHMNSKQERVM